MANDHLYARSADVSNGPWDETSLTTPSLFGISLELTKPDIYLITGFHKSVIQSGYSTTYTFTRKHVVLSTLLGSSKSLSTLGSVRWTITVGSQGEATASTLIVRSKHATTTVIGQGAFVQPARENRGAYVEERPSAAAGEPRKTAQESRLRVAAHSARPHVALTDLALVSRRECAAPNRAGPRRSR